MFEFVQSKISIVETNDIVSYLCNTYIIIVNILCLLQEDPYMMERPDPRGELEGNDRYEGYCVEMLDEISKLLRFNYSIKLVPDGQYGSRDGPNNEWTGMVKQLVDRVSGQTNRVIAIVSQQT